MPSIDDEDGAKNQDPTCRQCFKDYKPQVAWDDGFCCDDCARQFDYEAQELDDFVDEEDA